jgi:hypothetical protein
VEPKDFKNVIVENIPSALSLFVSSLGGWMLKISKMKVFQIRQSIAHFNQWKPLILKT